MDFLPTFIICYCLLANGVFLVANGAVKVCDKDSIFKHEQLGK
jgi:hypothetical protein